MKITFYGTRGSIPVCNPEFQEFGGNTTCIHIQSSIDNNWAVFDAGTGIRDLGKAMIKQGFSQDKIYILFSHFHWDHIQGFPFFLPAYDSSRELIIATLGKEKNLGNFKEILQNQMREEYFPIPMEQMGARMRFVHIEEDEFKSKKFNVKSRKHNHPGNAYSFRIEADGKSMVYVTDIEHVNGIDENLVEFSKDVDLLIHEAHYTNEELAIRKGWGHSSWEQAIEVAEKANARQLIITHHNPDRDDDFLLDVEYQCKQRFENVRLAREKMEINL